MNRRSFLTSILAAAAAPAFVKYGSLMVPKGVIQEQGVIQLEAVSGYETVFMDDSLVFFNSGMWFWSHNNGSWIRIDS